MNKARRWISAALLISFFTANTFAVEVNVNIKGCITDQKSKEPLIGATVQIVGSSIGAVTDIDGNFQLSGVEDGIYDIEIKYVGYKTAVKRQVKIENNKIDAFGVYASNGTNNTNSYSFRPVVTLNSNVQLDTTKAADGTQPSTAYEIK